VSDRTVRVKWSARDGGADRRRPAPRRRSPETHRTSPKMVFPGLFRLVFRSGSECERRRTHPGALGGAWGLWRGTQQRRAALRGRGLAGLRLRAGQRGNKGLKGHGKVHYLCATRRRHADGRSGGAEVLWRHCGGSELSEAVKRGERGRCRVLPGSWIPRSGSGSICEAERWVREV